MQEYELLASLLFFFIPTTLLCASGTLTLDYPIDLVHVTSKWLLRKTLSDGNYRVVSTRDANAQLGEQLRTASWKRSQRNKKIEAKEKRKNDVSIFTEKERKNEKSERSKSEEWYGIENSQMQCASERRDRISVCLLTLSTISLPFILLSFPLLHFDISPSPPPPISARCSLHPFSLIPYLAEEKRTTYKGKKCEKSKKRSVEKERSGWSETGINYTRDE